MKNHKPEFTVTADMIVAIDKSGIHHLWVAGTKSWQEKVTAREEYEKQNRNVTVSLLTDIFTDRDTDKAYIFYVADCMFPPLYLVFGSSFQDAYDNFVCEFESLVKIDDADLPDYGEDVTINDNGTAVDTESVQYVTVERLIVCDTTKGKE